MRLLNGAETGSELPGSEKTAGNRPQTAVQDRGMGPGIGGSSRGPGRPYGRPMEALWRPYGGPRYLGPRYQGPRWPAVELMNSMRVGLGGQPPHRMLTLVVTITNNGPNSELQALKTPQRLQCSTDFDETQSSLKQNCMKKTNMASDKAQTHI